MKKKKKKKKKKEDKCHSEKSGTEKKWLLLVSRRDLSALYFSTS